MVSAGADNPKLKVLVLHSGGDIEFADKLVDGLANDGRFEVSIDRDPKTQDENWKTGLGTLIANAETIVFILSPESAQASMCAWMVEHAHELSKRIIPVLPRPLGGIGAPNQLSHRNYVRFDEARSFKDGLKALVASLNTDIDWLREHTRLYARARKWEDAGQPNNQLLTGADIPAAKAWTFDRPKNAPKPTELHMKFISASEVLGAAGSNAAINSQQNHGEPKAHARLLAKKQPYWRSASRSYDAIIASLLVLLAAGAGWQALEARKQISQANRQATEASKNTPNSNNSRFFWISLHNITIFL